MASRLISSLGQAVLFLAAHAFRVIAIATDEDSSTFASWPTITSGTGAPSEAQPNGSMYLRTTGDIYTRTAGAWVEADASTALAAAVAAQATADAAQASATTALANAATALAAANEADDTADAAQATANTAQAAAVAAANTADNATNNLARLVTGTVGIGAGNTQQASADLGFGDLSGKRVVASLGQVGDDATAVAIWAVGQADGTVLVKCKPACTVGITVAYLVDAR